MAACEDTWQRQLATIPTWRIAIDTLGVVACTLRARAPAANTWQDMLALSGVPMPLAGPRGRHGWAACSAGHVGDCKHATCRAWATHTRATATYAALRLSTQTARPSRPGRMRASWLLVCTHADGTAAVGCCPMHRVCRGRGRQARAVGARNKREPHDGTTRGTDVDATKSTPNLSRIIVHFAPTHMHVTRILVHNRSISRLQRLTVTSCRQTSRYTLFRFIYPLIFDHFSPRPTVKHAITVFDS